MTSMTMNGGTRPRSATFSTMGALLRHHAEAETALVGHDLAASDAGAQAVGAAQRVGPPHDALRAQVVAVLAQGGQNGRVETGLVVGGVGEADVDHARRSEEHTSELQSLMRISYAVFCLK